MQRKSLFLKLGLAVLLILSWESNGYAATKFVLNISEQLTTQNAELKEQKTTVTISPEQYILIDKDRSSTVYDFLNRRIYQLNDGQPFFTTSLYTVLAYRLEEAQHRSHLGKILSGSGVKSPTMMLQPIIDHTFSLRGKFSKYTVSAYPQDGQIIYQSGKERLANISQDQIPIDKDDLDSFVMFLRYEYGMHPKILEKIKSLSGIPKKIVVYSYELKNEKKTTIELLQIEHEKSQSLRKILHRKKHRNVDKKSSELGRLVDAIDLRKRTISWANKTLLKSADKLFRNKEYLESALAYIQYSLQTGQALPNAFLEKKDQFMKQDEIRLLFASINPKSKELTSTAIENLNKFQGKAKKHGAILFVFEANLKMSLGDSDKVEALFLKALSQEPYLIGAYLDLGKLHFKKYDMVSAWLCWDTAKKMVPEHNLLKEVSDREQFYESKYPEYFHVKLKK